MEAERRQITVLFTDMVGFTSFSERAGEEAAFMLMQSLAKLLDEAVREQGGVVQGFTGDGIMAVFGAPVAFEDAPLRACRVALSILERLASSGGDALEARHNVRPQLRIGINAGLAVVGQVQGGEGAGVTVLGDNVNVAARLQSEAEPGTAVMSEAMHRLVQGLVAATTIGERKLKGKTEPQKVYRLDAILKGATRFKAAVGRGLSAYVGREHEMNALAVALTKARGQMEIVEVVAEPGMGKSRLLYEFRQHIDEEAFLILSGSCSPDGRQTAFLPFIDVVRGAFNLSAGEAESHIARKLEEGLVALKLNSLENLALLLNLLGLASLEQALAGLDGLLIGLRTRKLLHKLMQARCRQSPVVLFLEDLHWVDSVSEEVLVLIAESDATMSLLIIYTRRPEYFPIWVGSQATTRLNLQPLTSGQIKELVQARLGVADLPEKFARLIADRADGNALFTEEIVSFLTERGALRTGTGKIEFDPEITAAALPANVQSLLTARVDRLEHETRTLLQAAAVIGRRFDSRLLAATAGSGDATEAQLATMHTLDLVYPEGDSGGYAFKHALVRDALYQSLLTGPRVLLHGKVAEEIERRSDNRLPEVAETLAYHYSQTDRTDKSFAYSAMAGKKSLGVYSLDDAGSYLTEAIALLERTPACAEDEQILDLFVDYALYCNLSYRLAPLTQAVERFKIRLDRLRYDPRYVLVLHHHVLALLYSARYREAQVTQVTLTMAANQLEDVRSTAYALACDVHVSTVIEPLPAAKLDMLVSQLKECLSSIDDPYLQCFALYVVGWEEMHKGRFTKAFDAATELVSVGTRIGDPRSIGFGTMLRCWLELVRDNYDTALALADTATKIARTPFDHANARNARTVALVLLRRPDALSTFEAWMSECKINGWLYSSEGTEGFYGVALALSGKIALGVRCVEDAIFKREQGGNRTVADWFRMYLCEIYLEVISGKEKPSAAVLIKNVFSIITITVTAEKRILFVVNKIRENSQFDCNGQHIGRCEMILGLLYKARKKREQAVVHLTEARRIMSQFGPSTIIERIETALREVA